MKGIEIFSKLQKLKNEKEELAKATDYVGDELGRGTAPYLILREQYQKKADELTKFEQQEYYIAKTPLTEPDIF